MLGQLVWNTTGIARRSLKTLDDLIGFAQEAREFSSSVAVYLRQLSQEPLVQTKRLTRLQMDGTTNANYFPHGLKKPYTDGLIASHTLATSVRLMLPSEVTAAGKDPSVVVGIQANTAVAGVVNCMVF